MKIYSGFLKDKQELKQTSSGGAATALSKSIIQQGGCVFGVRYSSDFHQAEYCCIENIEDINVLKGSKYTESKKGNIYEVLSQKLIAGKKVLFFGLGCDIGAAKVYCEKMQIDMTNLYLVDILCHGPAVKGVHENFIQELEEKYNSQISDFTIRYKKEGWTPFYIKAKFNDGQEYVAPFDESDYGRAFRTIARPACTHCQFKGENHKGDICIGDYWGLQRGMHGWNDYGVSIMIVQTNKGEKLLEELRDDFIIQPADSKLVLQGNPMYYESRKQNGDYERFMMDMGAQGLHYAVQQLPKDNNGIILKTFRYLKRKIFGNYGA